MGRLQMSAHERGHTTRASGPMLTRRGFVVGGLAAAGGVAIIGGSFVTPDTEYKTILAEQTRPLPSDAGATDLIRFATLAANRHNTQAWKFRVGPESIAIEPDFARQTPVVDPDNHHLFASLGCAAENLSLAAAARGRAGDVTFGGGTSQPIEVSVIRGAIAESPLVAAIALRQCSRSTYDGSTVEAEVIDRLIAAARIDEVEPVVLIDAAQRGRILDLVVAGNSQQLTDPAFRQELKSWLRFNPAAAAASRDGLLSFASGNPSLPGWLGPIMFDLVVRKDGDNERVTAQIRSSSGIIVFVAPTDDPGGWVSAGRAYQRFALQSTLDGLQHAFINQAVEVAAVRKEVQNLLGLGSRRPS
jgi:hypothetical protein